MSNKMCWIMKKDMFFLLILFFPVVVLAQEFSEKQCLLPAPYQHASFDEYGYAVAVYGDYMVVGEPYYAGRGRVILYGYDGKEWSLMVELTPSDPQVRADFGFSVSIYGDTVVVGAPGDNKGGYRCGAVYVFGKPARGWEDMTETYKMTPPEGVSYIQYGTSVALEGNLLAVGSLGYNSAAVLPAVYLYQKEKEWSGKEKPVLLTDSDQEYGTRFGCSVDISGRTVVVGADKKGSSSYGMVYLFEEPADGWKNMTETARLTASDAYIGDRMGVSVSVSGAVVVAGMNNDNIYRNREGRAYLFVRPADGWKDMTETVILRPSDPKANDHFGKAVDVCGDTVAVGSYGGDGVVGTSGLVYIYGKPATGWSSVTETARLTASDGKEYDALGMAVSLWHDKLLAGAPRRDEEGSFSGAAYIYMKNTKGWISAVEDRKFLPKAYSTNQGDRFAGAMDMSGDYAVIGSAGYYGNRGRVTVYHYERGQWWRVAELTASDAAENDQFGYAVAMDGDIVAVGAPGHGEYEGAVYLYEMPAGGWQDMTETALLTLSSPSTRPGLGNAVALSGETVVAGAPSYSGNNYSEGLVCIFERPAGGWQDMTETALLIPSDLEGYDYFGKAVAIAGDVVVAGSPGDDDRGNSSGSLYLFEKPAGGWTDIHETCKLLPPISSNNMKMGEHLAMDSVTVVVGCSQDGPAGYASGSVYVFSRPAGGWSDGIVPVRLLPSDGRVYHYFGNSVDISAGRIAVGCFHDDDLGPSSGSVYLYVEPAGGWRDTSRESEKYLASDGMELDYFGDCVILSEDRFLVGAPNKTTNGSMAGAAYFFRKYDTIRITRQPRGREDICEGSRVMLTLQAEEVDTLWWQVSDDEGVTFSDLTDDDTYRGTGGDTLTFTFRVSMDSLLFRCVLSNPLGTEVSDTVRITADALPPSLEVQDVTVQLDEEGQAVLTPADVVTTVSDNCAVVDTLLSRDTLTSEDIGTVSVRVTVTDGVGNSVWKDVTVTVEEYTGIGDVRGGEIRVCPNPAGDRLHIEHGSVMIRRMTLLDETGRHILERRGRMVGDALDVSFLKQGVYFLRVTTDKGTEVIRFMKR